MTQEKLDSDTDLTEKLDGSIVPDHTIIEDLVPEAAARAQSSFGETLLDVRGLRTSFYLSSGQVKAVTGINFSVRRGEILGLVGESGCGKSVSSLSIMGLVAPPGKVDEGEVMFDGVDLTKLDDEKMRKIRGNRISMIFQQPTSSLNPVMNVGRQIGEVFQAHRGMKKKQAREKALEMMRMVGIPDPERRINAYPHEMSGGMAQRVMIAMALACEPELLIADEPTTALDVTIQAQILDLMRRLQRETNTAIILITHDLGRRRRDVRPRCGDVRRRDHRADRHADTLPQAAASVHAGADRLRAHPRPAQGRAGGHPGHGAQPRQSPTGLPVRAALPQSRGVPGHAGDRDSPRAPRHSPAITACAAGCTTRPTRRPTGGRHWRGANPIETAVPAEAVVS